jgi:hypothetical protein
VQHQFSVPKVTELRPGAAERRRPERRLVPASLLKADPRPSGQRKPGGGRP